MRKLSLLLIEGDSNSRQQIAAMLAGRYGDKAVTACGSLAEAVELPLLAFDLILTEWRLPDATGPAVIESLRAHKQGGIIVLHEANLGAVAAEAVLCGAADYVSRQGDYLLTLPLVIEKNLAFDKLRRERDLLHRQLTEQNKTLEDLLESLRRAAATDHLTGLYNRRHFARVLEQMFEDSRRSGADLSCVMLDMDGFKLINDSLGHQVGDSALMIAASTIESNLRRMDAAARYGGDEFVILLPRSGSSEAADVARRIRESYALAMRARGFAGIPMGMSLGVASVLGDAPETADALVAAADAALFRAKRHGRDRVIVSTARDPLTRVAS